MHRRMTALRQPDGLASIDDRVQVVANEVNVGHVVAFNNGYARATGDYVVRLDADDLLTPGSCARSIALFEQFPEVDLVYGRPEEFIGSEVPRAETTLAGWTVWRGSEWVAHVCRRGFNVITTPEAMIRTSAIRRLGGLSTRLHFAQDMEMWLRVASVSDVGHVDGADQALHREHEASMSATVMTGVLTDLEERRTVFEVLFDGPGGQLEDAATLTATWRRALATQAVDAACRRFERGTVDPLLIDRLCEYAMSTCPAIVQSKAYRALERRRSRGPRWSWYHPTYFVRLIQRRLREELSFLHWQRTGL